MIDLGEFQPAATFGPLRGASGTTLGRDSTTEEQRMEAIEKLAQAATENRTVNARATVIWSRGEPTVLELTCVVEHLNGKVVYLPDRVLETTLSGAEIPRDERARLRTLSDELSDMHDRAML